jgi:hypothetical protein
MGAVSYTCNFVQVMSWQNLPTEHVMVVMLELHMQENLLEIWNVLWDLDMWLTILTPLRVHHPDLNQILVTWYTSNSSSLYTYSHFFYAIYVSCIHHINACMPLGTSCWIHPSCKSCSWTRRSRSSHLCVWSAEVLFPFRLAAYLVLRRFSAKHVTYLVFPWFCRATPSNYHHIDGLPYTRGTVFNTV